MESKKLEALLMAVDLGSFTKAAEVMGYTQSGLTHMMNSLEREVGFTLLERGRGGVRLTKDGERVAPAIREFLQANARLDSTIAQVASSRSEVIRVSAFASMAMHWLPSIIRRFREERPDVDVDIRMADHIRSPYELLAQGKMDVIFVSRQEEESGYEWIHLRDDTMYAVLPKDYPIDGRRGIRWVSSTGVTSISPRRALTRTSCAFHRVGVKPHILPTAVGRPDGHQHGRARPRREHDDGADAARPRRWRAARAGGAQVGARARHGRARGRRGGRRRSSSSLNARRQCSPSWNPNGKKGL